MSFSEAIVEANPEDWRAMLETNILAVLAGSQAAVRAMRSAGGQGHIVTISSSTASRNDSGVYGATKHALNVIMTTLRKEVEHDPIRVTTIMPGPTATNLARSYTPDALKALLGVSELPFAHQQGQRLPNSLLDQVQLTLNELLCHPDDVARAALFAITQPIHVNISELTVRPLRNVSA